MNEHNDRLIDRAEKAAEVRAARRAEDRGRQYAADLDYDRKRATRLVKDRLEVEVDPAAWQRISPVEEDVVSRAVSVNLEERVTLIFRSRDPRDHSQDLLVAGALNADGDLVAGTWEIRELADLPAAIESAVDEADRFDEPDEDDGADEEALELPTLEETLVASIVAIVRREISEAGR